MKSINATTAISASIMLAIAAIDMIVASSSPSIARIETDANGNVTSRFSTDSSGAMHGEKIEYREDGMVLAKAEFHHGQPVSYVTYWPSGRMKSRMQEGDSCIPVIENFDDR
jgi:hypothetical protein